MGGNVFRENPTKRLERATYQELTAKVISALSDKFGKENFHELPYLKDKQSFGDADVLVKRNDGLNKTTLSDFLKSSSGERETTKSSVS